MKVAMWGVLLFALGIFGMVLMNIFGNITTVNQQDYTLIRNTVEASMYDAIDKASYRAGFYVCSKNGETTFSDKDEYEIIYKYNVDEKEMQSKANCKDLYGEIKIKADVFTESFLRRFAESVNNSKSYRVTVQEVIEYPPKVSVRIDTYDTYNSRGSTTLEFNEGDFNIRNQVDAIFEEEAKG